MSDMPLSGMLVQRRAGVEAAIEALRQSRNLTIAATAGVGAILAGFIIAFGIYGLQRLGAIDARLYARIDAVDSKLDTVTSRLDQKIDQKFDALAARFSEESARNRQELVGIATAISNSITAARQPPPGSPSSGAPTGPAAPTAPTEGGGRPPGGLR